MSRRRVRTHYLERWVSWLDDRIVNESGRVILAFILVTAVFSLGIVAVETEAGTEQFAQEIPENEALERINDEFGPRFDSDTPSTQLIQRDRNVLSKPSLLAMLEAQDRLQSRSALRVSNTRSAASIIALDIDPEATEIDQQRRTIRRSTDSQIRTAIRANADDPAFRGTLSNDFNARAASASATIGIVQHNLPGYSAAGVGQGGESPLTPLQERAQHVVGVSSGDITVFGSGIISSEFSQVIFDSIVIVVPASIVCIVLFLIIAYRDPLDLLLGIVALLMATIWTFGFVGHAEIPFNQIMIAIPPLLLAIGIDFGIHAVNRYREERVSGLNISSAMRRSTHQLIVAFLLVTGTTVIGFLANGTSDLQPIRDFGTVAAIGITFTFFVFGIFVPAAKVWIDRRRASWPIPTTSQRPLGASGTRLTTVLRLGVAAAERAPLVVLLLVLVGSLAIGGYAMGVDTSFSEEDFLPPEDIPTYLKWLPEPLEPEAYTVVGQLNFLEDKFETTQGDTSMVYIEARMEDDTMLEAIHRAGDGPPGSFVTDDGRAVETSIVSVIRNQAGRDPAFGELVRRNDRNGNGIPDRNLDRIYDELFASEAGPEARDYLTTDRRSTRILYDIKADASDEEVTEDTRTIANRHRGSAVATGNIVVFHVISNLILRSAITSLLLALGGTVAFLVFAYWLLEGYPSLGIANTVPIAVAVVLIAGSMRVLDIAFNAFTATILALTIGLGIDYSVHIVHRYIDERQVKGRAEALERTVVGTGGALTGSVLTTAFGIGVLVFAILDVLGQFGILTALSVIYSYLASLYVLPSVLWIWDGIITKSPEEPINDGMRSLSSGVNSNT